MSIPAIQGYGAAGHNWMSRAPNVTAGISATSFDSAKGGCETCASRTYKDGSDDPTVSFQTPTHISPGAAPYAVLSHEMEHVSHEQGKASAEGRRVISQTVTIQTSLCPE
jgi:hypothetical protein